VFEVTGRRSCAPSTCPDHPPAVRVLPRVEQRQVLWQLRPAAGEQRLALTNVKPTWRPLGGFVSQALALAAKSSPPTRAPLKRTHVTELHRYDRAGVAGATMLVL
jgi:hypothetical protein